MFAWRIENFDKLQKPNSLLFIDEILHTFPTCLYLQKGVLFRSWVIDKPVFCERVETRSFLSWQVTQHLNKIKKNPEHALCKISTKIIKLYGSFV